MEKKRFLNFLKKSINSDVKIRMNVPGLKASILYTQFKEVYGYVTFEQFLAINNYTLED